MSKFSIYCSELRASKGKSCFHCSNWELCYWSATGNEAAQRGKWDEMDGKTPQGQRYIRLKIKKKKMTDRFLPGELLPKVFLLLFFSLTS